jgi:two-component system, chemotaxis family, response regulator Rcp1
MNNKDEHLFHILVVEDNPSDVDLLRRALRKEGIHCELTVIDDGGEALELVRQQGKYAHVAPPDLVLLDLNLPKNDGSDILEAMRANPAFADLTVAVLTSSSRPRERARLERFDISEFVTKPADLDEYLKIGGIVRGLLNQKRDS